MNEPFPGPQFADILAEFGRIGLDVKKLQGLAVAGGDRHAFLTHLRGLPRGARWSDVFPGTPEDWTPDAPRPERSLGPFDYQDAPRGAAVFASLDPAAPEAAGAAALTASEISACRSTAADSYWIEEARISM